MDFIKNKKIIIIIMLAAALSTASFIILKNQENGNHGNAPIPGIKIDPPAGMEQIYEQDFKQAAEILAQNDDNYDAWLTIARIRAWSLDFEGALQAYTKMAELKPEDTLPYFNMGDVYTSLRQYAKAGEMYEKVIEINPKWVNAYREIFNLYRFELTDKYNNTIEDILKSGLEKSKDLGGEGYVDYYAMLAIYYDEKGDVENAIIYYEKTLELDPNNHGAESALERLKNL